MFKVLISDSMSTVAQEIFKKQNIETEIKTGLSEKEIINKINSYFGYKLINEIRLQTFNIVNKILFLKSLFFEKKPESVLSIAILVIILNYLINVIFPPSFSIFNLILLILSSLNNSSKTSSARLSRKL